MPSSMSASARMRRLADPSCLACSGALDPVLDDVFDTRFGVDRAFCIARCRFCGLEQTLPRPSPAELGVLYEAHYNFGGESGTAYTGLRPRFLNSGVYLLSLAPDRDIPVHTRPGPRPRIHILSPATPLLPL